MVLHFAGPVRYHTEGLVEKNKVRLGRSMWALGKKAERVTAARTKQFLTGILSPTSPQNPGSPS